MALLFVAALLALLFVWRSSAAVRVALCAAVRGGAHGAAVVDRDCGRVLDKFHDLIGTLRCGWSWVLRALLVGMIIIRDAINRGLSMLHPTDYADDRSVALLALLPGRGTSGRCCSRGGAQSAAGGRGGTPGATAVLHMVLFCIFSFVEPLHTEPVH